MHWDFYIKFSSYISEDIIHPGEEANDYWIPEVLFPATKKDAYLQILHLFVLSNALGRVFILYGPHEHSEKRSFSSSVFPIRRKKDHFTAKKVIAIAWHTTTNDDKLNHFVLLHPLNEM